MRQHFFSFSLVVRPKNPHWRSQKKLYNQLCNEMGQWVCDSFHASACQLKSLNLIFLKIFNSLYSA